MDTSPKILSAFVLGYCLIILLIFWHGLLGPDTYYYWQWSQHLDWSYYDGPPLIAYAIKFMTLIFGSNEKSILMLGLITIALTSYILYQTTSLIFKDKKVSNLSVLIWLISAGNNRHFFLLISYDTVLIIFWALTFYFFCQIIYTKKIKFYYLCGISIGLMLLAKYTGILLCVSLFLICIFYKEYNKIIKNKHFYFSCLVSFVIFSPVFIWNYQHHWMSFSYQLNHGLSIKTATNFGIKKYLLNTLEDYNVFFISLVFLCVKNLKKILKSSEFALVSIPSFFVWLFFFATSFRSIPGDSWHAPFFFTASSLLASFIVRNNWRKVSYKLLILMASGFTIFYILASRFPSLNPESGWTISYAMNDLTKQIPPEILKNKKLFSNDYYWIPSFISFFSPQHTQFFSTQLETGKQYYIWYATQKIMSPGESIYYFSIYPTIPSRPFKKCFLKKILNSEQKKIHSEKQELWRLYIFKCIYAP